MRQMSMQGRHHDKGQIKEELISTYETITMPNARSRGPVLDGLERGQACQLLHPRPQPLRCCLQHRLDSSHSIYWQLLGRRSSLSFGDNFHPECPDCLARQLLGQNLQSCGHEEIWWVFLVGGFFWHQQELFTLLCFSAFMKPSQSLLSKVSHLIWKFHTIVYDLASLKL